MTKKGSITLEDRKSDEEDATNKQLAFIDQLIESIGIEELDFSDANLGKWQASSAIDQLIAIRDSMSEHLVEIEDAEPKQYSLTHLLALLFVIWLLWTVFFD